MDVNYQIQLPPVLQNLSVTYLVLLALGILLFLAIIVSLAAFINNAPKSSVIRAFFAVIFHMLLTVTLMLVLIHLDVPPNEEAITILALVSAMIAFSVAFNATLVKGAVIAITTTVMYFLIYKCTILFLQTQYPDIYQQYAEVMSNLLTHYELIR